MIERHFWVVIVIMTVLYARMWWREVQEPMRRQPELAPGYRGLYRAQITVGLVPWLLMGVGVILGQVGGVDEFAPLFAGFPGSPGHPRDLPWFPLVFPFFFVALWVGVGFLLAATGGWQTVAAHYPLVGDAPPPGKRFGAAEFGLVGYNRCLKLSANQRGLYFATILLFRAGHAPFFVPWTDVTARATRRWFRSVVELRFARTPDIAVRLPRATAEALFRQGGRQADFPSGLEGRA